VNCGQIAPQAKNCRFFAVTCSENAFLGLSAGCPPGQLLFTQSTNLFCNTARPVERDLQMKHSENTQKRTQNPPKYKKVKIPTRPSPGGKFGPITKI
jgi:hypothetical protein